MKTRLLGSIIIIAIVFTISTSFTKWEKADQKNFLSVEKAIKCGILEVRFASKGGHTGFCMVAEITSKCDKDTFILFEAGRQLASRDSSLQDILLTRDQLIAISPGEGKKVNLYGFCCQVHNNPPKTGSIFDVGKMADSLLVVLASYLNLHSNISRDDAQHAVWVLSDHIPVASVKNPGNGDNDGLKALLSKLKGIEIPWYSISYVTVPERLFTGEANQLFGEISYYIQNNSYVSLVVYDISGKVVKVIFEDIPHNPDHYNYSFTMDVSKLPHGRYYLRLFDGVQKKVEKVFEI